MTTTLALHATAIARRGAAVLLRGESGAGKSDLAIRLIAAGWCLVADDRVELRRADGRLLARAPAAIAGKIEARGIGILAVAATGDVPVALIVDLVPPERVERMPDPPAETLLGVAIPRATLSPLSGAG